MRIELKLEGIDSVREALAGLSGKQAAEAYAKALNDVGFAVQRRMRAELRSSFDRPTAFIANSPKVVTATPGKLSVRIIPTLDARNQWSNGGKIGVDPQQVLQAQEYGGRRADKRSEVVLRRAGILPAGYQTSIPAVPFPGSDDGRGNLRGGFITQLLAYLQSFGEQGYRANMTAKSRARVQKGREQAGPLLPGRKRASDGRRYFVSYGRLRSGRASHLAPGIWAAIGALDVDVRPVLMFVRAASYRPRISMERIAADIDAEGYLERRLRFRIRQAAGL